MVSTRPWFRSPLHHDDLVEATRDGALWTLWYTSVPSPESMAGEIARRLELQTQGLMLPFAVIHRGLGKAVGMTTFQHRQQQSARRDRRNLVSAVGAADGDQHGVQAPLAEPCLLDTLGCIAVEFRTHLHNQRSRAGIERLGAKLDGILRNHQRNLHPDAEGSYRDTCVYSILPGEWPAVRANLRYRLSQRAPT